MVLTRGCGGQLGGRLQNGQGGVGRRRPVVVVVVTLLLLMTVAVVAPAGGAPNWRGQQSGAVGQNMLVSGYA